MECKYIGDAELWLGDAMDMVFDPPPEGFIADLIITDPPYPLTSGGESDSPFCARYNGGDYDNSGNLFDGDIPEWSDFMPLLYKRLRDPGHAYIMANNRNVQPMLNAAAEEGFGFHNLLVWDKRTATPNRWYMKNCEFTGFFYKGKAFMLNNCSAKMLISVPQVDESDHPTEKPVMLMRHYIENSSQPGETVFDPFMGSGTTGVAALQSGRKFVGIERDERFFDIACRRIAAAVNHQQKVLI